MSLYAHAQLDGDNSELDALKRLALSHDSNVASCSNSGETSLLPTLPFSTALSTNKRSTKNAVPATAVTPSAECKVKVESASLEHPVSAKSAKLLLIPGSLSSVMKQHSVTMQSLTGAHSGQKHGPLVSGGGTKRRIQSDSGPKSVPLGDVMNVRSASALEGRRSLVSLVPLSSAAASSPSYLLKPDKSASDQQLRIKLEPGLSGPRAGKRKPPLIPGMVHCFSVLIE